MFNEEWELLTEPLLQQALPVVSLSGIATHEDDMKGARTQFKNTYQKEFSGRDQSQDNIDDLVKNIKSPVVEKPDIKDPLVFAEAFESKNRNLQVFFTQETMDGLFELYEDLSYLRGK